MKKESKKLFKDDDPGTYDPKTKKHAFGHLMINSDTGDITCIGKTPPDKFIPEGWVKISDNRYVPTWPTCRYRRLSIKTNRHKSPDIKAVCLHTEITDSNKGKPVDHSICNVCPLFEATFKSPQLTDDEIDSIFRRDYRDDLSDIPDEKGEYHIDIPGKTIYNEEYWDDLESTVYEQTMKGIPPDNPQHQKNTRKIHQKWGVPCIHRYEQEKQDCNACSEIKCNNPKSEKFGLKILRRDCKLCPVVEKPI